MRHGPSEQVYVIGAVQINVALERIAPRAAIDAVFEPIEGEDAGEDQIVLARVASQIAEAGSNIDSITTEEDRSLFTTMHLVIEVANRQHLARVMRSLRRLPDVKKISRARE
jgi:predicted regulator of amino acid metabolism with ACT domain